MKNRKPNRLKNYDYSRAGAYFITICTHNKENYFGVINDGIMELNEFGRVAHEMWSGLPKTFKNILLDIFVIMPNHMHGIIAITEDIFKTPDNPVGDAYPIIVSSVGNATEHIEKTKPVGDAYSIIDNTNNNEEINLESTNKSNPTNMRPLHEQDRSKMYLSKIIQIYKSKVSRKINNKCRINKIPEIKLWQRSFYDRIIRSEKEFYNIQQYIFENPARWEFDKENNNIIISDIEYYNKIFGTF